MLPAGAQTLIVFSHPNHELAVFGLLQRLRPHLLYLTDGGGYARVEETLKGLDSIGLSGQATFLNHPEKTFYDALLTQDSSLMRHVATAVREVCRRVRPQQIICDAVEFYNPIHDLSLPIVRAAVQNSKNALVYEVPLIYQEPKPIEVFAVQRLPASRAREGSSFSLSPAEIDAKIAARDQTYNLLRTQLGPVITDLPRSHLAVEFTATAREELPKPPTDVFLRYEARAKFLHERGEIGEQINYQQHYAPLASSLFDTS